MQKLTTDKQDEIKFLQEKIRTSRGNGIGKGSKLLGQMVARLKVLRRSPSVSKLHKMSAKPTRTSLRQSLRPNKSKK